MRTTHLRDEQGRVFAFEVPNIDLTRRRACRIAASIPGASITRRPVPFSWFREDTFCRFELSGVEFVIWEAWGDSDAYWIGPEPPIWCEALEPVLRAFEAAPEGLLGRLATIVGWRA